MIKHHRQERIGEEIKKSISNKLLNGIKDPRLTSRIVSISGVEVTSDGSYATIYIAPLTLANESYDEVAADVLSAFNHAKGTFRKQVGLDIKLRHIPELIFKIDSSMEYGRHIDELMKDIHYGDADNEDKDDRKDAE